MRRQPASDAAGPAPLAMMHELISFEPKPVTLVGKRVRLEPLRLSHAAHLSQACSDDDTWRFMPTAKPVGESGFRDWIQQAECFSQPPSQIAFAIVLVGDGVTVGSTRFLNIRREHRCLEIGYTWIGPRHRRAAVNTECKYLLMAHAFETLGAVRVEFKTDSRNKRSQKALERIGATCEGVLRSHMILWDGYRRDSVYYGVTDADWPVVKSRLQAMLLEHRPDA